MGQVLRAVPSPSQGETGHQLRGVSGEREREGPHGGVQVLPGHGRVVTSVGQVR